MGHLHGKGLHAAVTVRRAAAVLILALVVIYVWQRGDRDRGMGGTGDPSAFSATLSSRANFGAESAESTRLPTIANAASSTSNQSSSRARVVATATDVQAVVLVDDHGVTHTYGIGNTVSGSRWRVAQVGAGNAAFESADRYLGQVLAIHLSIGDTLNFAAAQLAPPLQSATPHTRPQVAKSLALIAR